MQQGEKHEIVVSMSLPQHKGKSGQELYELFKKRVQKKSRENKADKAINPTQLILAFPFARIDTQMGVVVEKNSFMMFGDDEEQERGFFAKVECAFGKYQLYVYKRGKALLEPI